MKTYKQKLLDELATRRAYYSDDSRKEYAIEYDVSWPFGMNLDEMVMQDRIGHINFVGQIDEGFPGIAWNTATPYFDDELRTRCLDTADMSEQFFTPGADEVLARCGESEPEQPFMFEHGVEYGFCGRNGKHLCVSRFKFVDITTLVQDLEDGRESMDEAWCRALLHMLYTWDYLLSTVEREEYITRCAADMYMHQWEEAYDEWAEAQHWAARGVQTEAA